MIDALASPMSTTAGPEGRGATTGAGVDGGSQRPLVSVVVPCRNEQSTIGKLLGALDRQTYDPARTEVLIIDGRSTDETRRAIAAYVESGSHRAIRVLDNPRGTTPAALNIGVAASRGAIVIRMDAHTMPAHDYVERCVDALTAQKGDNVGGHLDVRPTGTGTVARAIAVAAAHPFGAGDAAYRIGGREGEVDTVAFGAFFRATLDRVGPFDESLPVNQDFEFNARLRADGGRVWFDPRIRCVYFARPNLRALGTQYWRYGRGKRRMLALRPGALRPRQIAAPALVAVVLASGALATSTRAGRVALRTVGGAYAAANAAAVAHVIGTGRPVACSLATPLAFTTMHAAWGAGFLAESLIRIVGRGRRLPRAAAEARRR